MLVTVLAWAYAHRVTSSRRIEELCRTDVAFRVICGGNLPDHVTIARFRADFADAVAGFFAAGAGVVRPAGDGPARGGGAGRHQDRRERVGGGEPDRGASGEAGRRDGRRARRAPTQAEDELFGAGRRGDEVPAGGVVAAAPRRADRCRAGRAAKPSGEPPGEAERAKAAEFRARQRAGQRTGCSPLSAAVALAEENLERVRAARAAQVAEIDRRWAGAVRRDGQGRRGWGRPRVSRITAGSARRRQGRGGPPRARLPPPAGPRGRRRAAPGLARCATSLTRTRG